ncbi:TetR family transcriptional regulator [Actinocrispum sp. NPDC049592]|uniref:TetR/AcrR family transcriptional regulator n=1 Tax=Actinocrispum sp. NPDC049592 TaxID=3154835 RepID=UPI003434DF12
MTAKREQALSAAIELLGTGGLRALTHARIDEQAGLPKGTTSNYFRTRAALLAGVVEWMLEQETPAVSAALHRPSSADEFVDEACRLIDFMTGPNRTVTAARMVLWVEGAHDETLRQALMRGRARMADLVVPALARLGARDPDAAAQALAACFDGLFMNRIARHVETDARPIFETVVRGALAQTV